MRKIQFIILCFLLGTLAACSKYNQAQYLKSAERSQPLASPPGIVDVTSTPYYQVPQNIPVPTRQQPVSLIPPGSRIMEYKGGNSGDLSGPQAQAHVDEQLNNKSTLATAETENKSAHSNSLVLKLPPQKAWVAVGQALQSAHFQILDQDDALGSYYVLDREATGNQITANTPIYDIQIVGAEHGYSKIEMLTKDHQPVSDQTTQRLALILNQMKISS